MVDLSPGWEPHQQNQYHPPACLRKSQHSNGALSITVLWTWSQEVPGAFLVIT